MSSGGMIVAPVAIPVVAAGAVVIVGAVAVGAAAVFAAKAANAAVEGAVRAVGDWGAAVEARIEAQEADVANALRWEHTAVDVIGLNARIRLLQERAAAAGVSIAMPSPLRLGRSASVDEMRRWTAAAQDELVLAQQALDAALPPPRLDVVAKVSTADADTAAAMDRYRETLRQRHSVAVGTVSRSVSPDEITRLLSRLDSDVTTSERDEVLMAAANVHANEANSEVYLRQLRVRVGEANEAVARRRLAATWLQTLEKGPVAEALAGIEPPPLLDNTAVRLRAVVSGTDILTPELRGEAVELVAWAEKTAQHVFLRDLVRDCLAEKGYAVEETFDANQAIGLRLRHAGWAGEHAADVWVDENDTVQGMVVRQVAASGEDARLTDQSRCGAFADDFEGIAKSLVASGEQVTVAVDRDRRPPVVTETSVVPDSVSTVAPKLRAR